MNAPINISQIHDIYIRTVNLAIKSDHFYKSMQQLKERMGGDDAFRLFLEKKIVSRRKLTLALFKYINDYSIAQNLPNLLNRPPAIFWLNENSVMDCCGTEEALQLILSAELKSEAEYTFLLQKNYITNDIRSLVQDHIVNLKNSEKSYKPKRTLQNI